MINEYNAIQNVMSRFINCFDLKDWLAMEQLLCPPVKVDYANLRSEPTQMVSANEYVQARKAPLENLFTQHLISNFEIYPAEIGPGTQHLPRRMPAA